MGVDHPNFGTFCCICFNQLKKEDCAEDKEGQKFDVCKGVCAIEADLNNIGKEATLKLLREFREST